MKLRCLSVVLFLSVLSAHAAYVETMDPNGPFWNLKADFGLIDDGAQANQSELFQKAVDEVSAKGGGRLIMPKGTYLISGVSFKSNVHLLVEKDTVIKPLRQGGSKGGKVHMFTIQPEKEGPDTYLENVSIRGMGGPFIIDYSDWGQEDKVRAIRCGLVKNFLLSDILFKDNFTAYCTVVFGAAKSKGSKDWPVNRPTDGLVKNLKAINTSPGYGLLQMHGGRDILFENLSAIGGGVTFRLETGAGGIYGGVHDIIAKNLYCENGSASALLGPHASQNGMVTIDGVRVKSCAFAVTMGPGYVSERQKENSLYKPGRFADGTTVKNVHAVFGTNAPVSLKNLSTVPAEYLKNLRFDPNDIRALKRVRGPSIGVVRDSTGDSWMPIIENVTSEGFTYNKGVIRVPKKKPGNWREFLKGLPLYDELSAAMEAKKEKAPGATKKKSSRKKNS